MARQDNFFALLGDGDDDDISTLVERVAAMKVEPPAEEKKKKEKQQQRQQKQPEEKEESEWGPEDTGSMKAKPLVLPDHVTRRDIVVRKRQPEGQSRGDGRDSERSGPGGKGYRRSVGGADGYQPNNRRHNGYQLNNGGLDGYQQSNGGGSGFHGSNGGKNDFQRNDGADAENAIDNGWQEQGRGHGGRGRGRGRGGRGRGFNQSNEWGSESQGVVSSYQTENQGHDGNGDNTWEQNEFKGKVHGSEAHYDEKPRNVNRGPGSNRRGYGGGNRGFRGQGQQGRLYDSQDGKDNRRGEVSIESEVKENISGVVENPVKVEDYSGGAEWDVPVTTEEPTDVAHEQGKIEVKDNPEKTAKDTKEEDEEEKEMTLEEYEKLLFEKRKALESSKKTEERKVTLDKDLESMQRVERKKDDNLDIKQKSDEKLKKKVSLEKDNKVRKSMSINEFLKPAVGEWHGGRGRGRGGGGGGGGRGRGRGGRVESRGDFLGHRRVVEADPAPLFEDPKQFPVLGGAVET